MRPGQRLKNFVLFLLLAGLYAGLNALPLRAAAALGAGLGRLFYWLVPFERKKTLRQLAIAFPDWAEGRRRKTAQAVFAHLGRGGAEFFRFPRLSVARLETWVAEVQGLENIQRAQKSGRGVVFVTAHMGHWELLAAWTAQRLKVAVAARPLYDPKLDARLVRFREQKGITVFPRGASARRIMRWLSEGGTLGALADQDTGVDSLYVPFFGREAKTPSSPAWLAAATGAMLMTAFCWRREDGRYGLRFETEIPVEGADLRVKRTLYPAVLEYTRRTEAFVREHPEQWAFNHDRWRSRKDQASTGWDPCEA